MKVSLSTSLEKKDINNLISRYHFSDTDYEKLHALYLCLLPLIDAIAYVDESTTPNRADVLLTLGDGIDKLRDLYSDKSLLSEAYMVECLGFELLTSAYKSLILEVQKSTDMYVTAIDFLGDKYPIELQTCFIDKLSPDNIQQTRSGMLSPSKSVSMILSLSEDKPDCTDLFNTCATCPNVNCSHRFNPEHAHKKIDTDSLPRTYGNQTIFGI